MSDLSPTVASAPAPHHWKFFRAGGFDQVRLDTAEDLLALRGLDPKLWVALSCPVGNIDFAPETLAVLDADADGHIRSAELLAAIEWCRDRLADKAQMVSGGTRIPLDAISMMTETGQHVHRSARQILKNMGRPDAPVISLDDVTDLTAIFDQTRFNGDGIITLLSADTHTQRDAISAIGTALGTQNDRSGEEGVNAEAVGTFFTAARAWRDWQAAEPEYPTGLDPLGASEAYIGMRDKIDDFFTRCRLAAYDGRASTFMNGSDAELDSVGRSSLATPPCSLVNLPLARVEAGRSLPLLEGVNPAWQGAMDRFRLSAVLPMLGEQTALNETAWQEIKGRLAALADWFASRPALPAEADPITIMEWLDGDIEAELLNLIEQDTALSEEAAGIDEVRKLLLLVRDLATFANNFVSFRDFYTRKGRSTFQCGTLYIDGRSCDLVVPVSDVSQHGALATLSRLYLVYCACRRGAVTRHIVAAMTDGSADQLMVGRNGVFIDREGKDWDAQIVRLVEHPISLRQAFWAPYQRIGRMVSEQLQKLAASRAQAAEQKAAVTMIESATRKTTSAATPAASAPATPPPFDVAKFAGIFAAVGLAIGAIGTVLAAVVTGFISLSWWQMPLAILGLLVLLSGPSLIIAWFKLRSRTLGPLLDANGWAINARAAINLPFGRSLTQLAKLPAGAERALTDPYAEKKTVWPIYAVSLAIIGAGIWLLIHLSVK